MVSTDRVGHSAGYPSVYRSGGAAALCGKISGFDFHKSDATAARIGSGRSPVCFLRRHRRPRAPETVLLLAGLAAGECKRIPELLLFAPLPRWRQSTMPPHCLFTVPKYIDVVKRSIPISECFFSYIF